MDNQIYDGKCHALTDQIGYITKLIDVEKSFLELKMIEMDMLKEYAKYLIENQKEKCLEIICQNLTFSSSEDFSTIYRPSWMCGILSQKSQLAIKFKRLPNDDLTNECDHCTINNRQL